MTRTLLILAGGTGGHIMPGLAIAKVMQARGWNIRWLGTAHGMENRLVPAAGIRLDTVAFSGLRGKGVAHAFKGAWQLVSAVLQCFSLVGRVRPDAVLGMGGYVTVPAGLSAALRRRPLLIMNCDAAMLLSNRILRPFARRILFGLPANQGAMSAKSVWTGNPVRAEIVSIAEPDQRYLGRSGPLSVLVVGGSLGASVLNAAVPAAIALMPIDRRVAIVHQTGTRELEAVQNAYARAGIAATVSAFIDDMAGRYAAADVVVCRAGATTVSELTAAGVASVLVPLTVSTTTHQRDNANYLEDAGAAVHLPQTELSAQSLASLLSSLSRETTLAMARAARALGKPHATEGVADEIESVLNGQVFA